jgi:hypothetical protein
VTVSNTDGGYDATHEPPAAERHTPPPAALTRDVRLGVHQLLLHGLSLEEQIAAAHALGWSALGLLRLSLWRSGEERIADLLQEAGLAAASLSWAGGFTGTTGFTFREAVVDGRLAIREAAALGAETLIVAPGARGGHTLRHAQRVTFDGLRYLADAAAEHRVRLAVMIDPAPRRGGTTSLCSLESVRQLFERVNCPLLGLACPVHRWEGLANDPSEWNGLANRVWVAWSGLPPDEVRAAEVWRQRVQSGLQWLMRHGFSGGWEFWTESPGERCTTADARWRQTVDLTVAIRDSLSRFAGVESGRRSPGW